MVVVAQLYKFTKNHGPVHLEWVNFMVYKWYFKLDCLKKTFGGLHRIVKELLAWHAEPSTIHSSAFPGQFPRCPGPTERSPFPNHRHGTCVWNSSFPWPASHPGRLLILQDSEQINTHLRSPHHPYLLTKYYLLTHVSPIIAVLLKLRLMGCEINFMWYNQHFLKK